MMKKTIFSLPQAVTPMQKAVYVGTGMVVCGLLGKGCLKTMRHLELPKEQQMQIFQTETFRRVQLASVVSISGTLSSMIALGGYLGSQMILQNCLKTSSRLVLMSNGAGWLILAPMYGTAILLSGGICFINLEMLCRPQITEPGSTFTSQFVASLMNMYIPS